MKKKVLSVLLATSMVVSLAAANIFEKLSPVEATANSAWGFP